MKHCVVIAVVSAMAALIEPQTAGAVGQPTPGAVTPQTVKVPDGPGSVRGLASDATVNIFTGQVAYEIPVELPLGPGGLTPKLTLRYSGGLGNGPLGIGWTFGQVGVRRSLRFGVPSYNNNDELELMGLAGATLVPIGDGQYRAEGQGNSTRGVAIDGGFELVDAGGTRYRLGTSDASRLGSESQVAAWYLERVTDVAGHVIDYTYERQGGELYLTAITWGGDNAFRAELLYEDRSDVVMSWRTGFKISAGRRLTTVRVWSFADCSTCTGAPTTRGLRRTVELTYDQSFALSRLASVRVIGPDGTATPTTTFTYATPTVGSAQVLGNTGGWNLGNSAVSFFDVDKDGAMDLLRVEASGHRYRRNLGGSFGQEVTLGGASGLPMSAVRMLDLDGDSGAEMVIKSGSMWRAFRIVNGAWVQGDWPGSSSLDLQTVAVADLNGDFRMDVLVASGSGISVWFGTANGFGALRTLPAISSGEPTITPATVQFQDLNGDGLADAVAVNSDGLIAFRGRGNGTFERIGPIAYPWTGTTDPTQVRLADLDRDGLLDIVRIGSTQVFWHRGRPSGAFSGQPTRVLNRPAGADSTTVVALADVNGNGSTDVVWSSENGMWALDLAGPTNAGLLVGIDNGLGKTQRFEYTASTQLAWAADQAGSAWTQRMPVSIAVTTTATQVLASGDPDRTSLLNVRDGIYEPTERRFIGFAQSILTLAGTGSSDTIRIVSQFHPGHGADRALRGQVLSTRIEDGAGRVFRQTDNDVAALSISRLPDDPRFKRAAVTQTRVTSSEPGETPAVVRTRFVFDAEGRPIEERRDGRVLESGALDGDESIRQRAYSAEDPTTGVRDLVCEETVLDGAGVVVSRIQRRFGDDSAVAPPCQPGKGWVREELGYLAEEARWVSLRRTSYDSHGNPVLTFANGVERTIGYDAHNLHAVSESVSPTAGQTLTWTAEWDDVTGTLIRVGDPNGIHMRMTYDGIGRLTSTAINDAPAHIHYRYTWEGPRPKTETFVFDGDPAALGSLPSTWTPGAGWRHAVSVTNGAGEQLLSAVQLDVDQWNVSELRQRDRRGRVTALTSPFSFHGSNVTTAMPPTGAATQTLVYDPLDRVVDQMLPTGSHKRVTYHPMGATFAIDGLAPVQTVFDGQGRTAHTERVVNGIIESVDATYDAAGRLLQFSLQGGQVHHDFVYDSIGRLIYATDPDVGPRTLHYDDGGRPVRTENGAGEVITYNYDGAGRLMAVEGADIANHYHYDVPRTAGFDHTAGQLAWAEESTGSVDLGYDDFGRLVTQQRTIVNAGETLVGRETTQLSPSGLIRNIDLGDGVALPIRYDVAGRVSEIEGVWSVESYDPANAPMRERFGNGVVQRYERDVLHRPTRVVIENTREAFYDVTASYNEFSSIDTLADNDQAGLDHTATFSFDGAGRLTAATMGTGSAAYHFSYAYDGLQNMIRREASRATELGILAGTYQYRVEAPRQLASVVAANGDTLASFAYDGAGRQIQHGDKQLTYNALSQLVQVGGVAGGPVEHRYGYDGNRVSTRSASGAMTYWITPNVVIRGIERDHYLRIGDQLVAKITTTTAAGPSLAAGILAHGRTALAGLSLIWIIGLTGVAGLRRQFRGLRPLRAALAGSLALLMIATGCGSGSAVSSRTAAVSETGPTYFHRTYAAGPELTTDAAGELQEERRTEPFGAAIDAFIGGAVHTVDYRSNPINSLNKFTDPDTSWSYHGARWLAPDTAQWHSPDPPATAPDPKFMLQPWSLHPYQYVEQNPVAYWDPDGREGEELLPLGAGAGTAGVGAAAGVSGADVLAGLGALAAELGAAFGLALPVAGLGASLFIASERPGTCFEAEYPSACVELQLQVDAEGMELQQAAARAEADAQVKAAAEAMTGEPPGPFTRTLYHYTNEAGLAGILETEVLQPSLKAVNPSDARYGDGQYLSDIKPGTKTPSQLSAIFIQNPYQGARFTHYVEIDVTGLNVFQAPDRPRIFVIPNQNPLDLENRIRTFGQVP